MDLENYDFNGTKPSHIYDTLDSQMIQDDEDDEEEGILDDPDYAGRNPDGQVEEPRNQYNIEESKYKQLIVPDDDDLLEMTRKLVPEQMDALSKVIKYCKDVRRNFENVNHEVKPLRLIISGGSGSGKSTITRLLYRFFEPSQGNIRVGQFDVSSLELDTLR